jgi:hypothetical protein
MQSDRVTMNLQKKPGARLWGAVLGIAFLPMIPLLDHIGRFELVYPVICSVAAIGMTIRGYWESLGKLWFWGTITIIAALHLFMILRVPWKAGRVPVQFLIPICIVDFAIVLGIVGLVEKVFDPSVLPKAPPG